MTGKKNEGYLIETKSDADIYAETAQYVAWCMRGILELTRSAVKTGEIDVQALEPVLCVLLDNGTELEDNIRRARSEIEELDPPRRVAVKEAMEKMQTGGAA